MAQPTDRLGDVPPPREFDEERGEFWVPSPWKFAGTRRNLSAYERNQVFLNRGGLRFLDVGHLTGADSDGDGRGALVADVDGDLAPDLIVRQSGGGPVRVYANRFPPTGRLEVSLRGTKSNRLGVGARVVAYVGERRLVREMFPANNFVVQQASRVRFGLGDAESVDRLVVHWPSGAVSELSDVPAGRHVRIIEGEDEFHVVSVAEPRDR